MLQQCGIRCSLNFPQLKGTENQVKTIADEKESSEQKLQHEILSLRMVSDQLKTEIKVELIVAL